MSNTGSIDKKIDNLDSIYILDCENKNSIQGYNGEFYFIDTKVYGKNN